MNHPRNPLAVASLTETFFTERPHPTPSLDRQTALHASIARLFQNPGQFKRGPDRCFDEASRGFFLSYRADITS
jgi:hypothetical protein